MSDDTKAEMAARRREEGRRRVSWIACGILTVLLVLALNGYYWLGLILGFPAFMVLREYEKEQLAPNNFPQRLIPR